ncbi:MAG TPA: hypothetical protein VGJ95_05595 [Pseudonocardiaceae bacterium]|jgi:hypothetical protein
MSGVQEPRDLWRAEAAWWARLHRDGSGLVAGSRFGPDPVIGSCALLAADAWRVTAALELVARGQGQPELRHVLA